VNAEPEEALSEPIDTDVVIETPEHVRFRHTLAGPTRRVLAYVVDTAIRIAAFGTLAVLAYIASPSKFSLLAGLADAVLWLSAFALEWGYFVVFETLMGGQTPGKRALQLRVVSSSGRPLGFVDSVLRNVLRAADFLPFGYALGFTIMAGDSKFRRLGDRVAGTLVVVEEKRKVDEPIPRLALPSPEELAAVPANLALSPAEIAAIELYFRRRPRLREARAEELAEIAVRAIAKRSGVRYRSPGRLLELLYYRAIGGAGGRP
jgi:uncharacterized RDD family membrane protein YckC